MNRISRHLSTKLGLGILLMAAPVFVITLGMLFLQLVLKKLRGNAVELRERK